ncbi:cardiomyopathy-associated protein 5 [Salarias fasciatus]|uniref:cardiomyopathy-associated protein 5 n=1 Tax=Salarias fasciatus TaxID=181472 RepID=UPI0011768313|nr:cardiomyopathy-associated protein 5-like [Salarias fasciatus]
MDTVAEDFARSDVDPEMTVLTPDDFTGINSEAGDEVENLRNSLREVVHDDSVRPKMQCLMMDSSFSMVTMQGEDSGIAWETTPSRCNTPWASEAGNQSMDFNYSSAAYTATAGSHPAGKIIFVMDEDLMSRRKKPKERVSVPKSKESQQEALGESSDNISGRPELVEVSQPNVRPDDIDQEELIDPLEDKEQQLFSLVSEGSEILNIIVPPKLDTVDEEESKEMVDNLSYLEESPVAKASLESHDNVPADVEEDNQEKPSPPAAPDADPPGAPVARPPPVRGPAGNVDYFDAFALIDAQAPGSPAVISEGLLEPEVDAANESKEFDNPEPSKDTSASVHTDTSDSTSVVEITSELLDELFYGGTDNCLSKSFDTAEGGGAAKSVPLRLPSKTSGSSLFGSQEDILTPIFLPEGPPKIIDPILLEEPKAMAFLYTDLYEEALGTRQKEEDAESLTSEKSFHSRHSDREARGYLEKYVLIDETPVVEGEPADKDKQPTEGTRILTQDLYDFGDFVTQPETSEMPNSEEEITDFFRSSGNSSPCDIESFPRSLEEDDTQKPTKSKATAQKTVPTKVAQPPVDPLSISSFEFPTEEPDWEVTGDHPMVMDDKDISAPDSKEVKKQNSDIGKPVAPPRKKSASALKACLDLTPLTPADVEIPEQEEVGIKEQREEEKETASPVETADEGDGDGEETIPVSLDVTEAENLLATSLEMDILQENNEITIRDMETEGALNETETAAQQTEAQETDVKSGELDKSEKQQEISVEATKNKGQCVIL